MKKKKDKKRMKELEKMYGGECPPLPVLTQEQKEFMNRLISQPNIEPKYFN